MYTSVDQGLAEKGPLSVDEVLGKSSLTFGKVSVR
jgi:hypothetical protein